jgi:hypothetical protein
MRNTECQCPSCRRIFASVDDFDGHRAGPYDPPGQRRCYSDSEMRMYFVCIAGTWRRRRVASNEERGALAGDRCPALAAMSRSA